MNSREAEYDMNFGLPKKIRLYKDDDIRAITLRIS